YLAQLTDSSSHERYVVSSDGSHHSGSHSEAAFFVRFPAADASVVTIVVTTTVDADVADDPYVFWDLTDRLAPSALFTQPRAIDYDQLYSEFNIGAARQVCLGVEVKMRAKHTLEKKGELEDNSAEQTTLLPEKDTEIAHLKSLLSLKEAEAAEAISLRNQLSVVGATDVAKSTKLRDLKEKTFALKEERDAFSEKVATPESVTTSKEDELASLSSQVTKLTADLSSFQLSRDKFNSKVAFLKSERDCLVTQKNSLEAAFEL
nr:hypothetical protein [Tanacetum cinerariifolium]